MVRDSELEAENARLQDGYDGLKYQYDEEHDKLLRLQARVEEAERDRTHLLESIDSTLDAFAETLEAVVISPEHNESPAQFVWMLAQERDRYKALAGRRKKALEQFSDPVGEGYERIQPTHLRIWAHDIREREGYESILVAFLLRMADRFDDARAAIEEEEK